MSEYRIVSPEVEDAIASGNVAQLGKLLPNPTGMELDRHGFPLLLRAVQSEQPEIFKALLDTGKFHASTRGISSYDSETLRALGCTPDRRVEKSWGSHGKWRTSLFDKLYTEAEMYPGSPATQMLEMLVDCPTAHIVLTSKDCIRVGSTQGLPGIAAKVISNPTTSLLPQALCNLLNNGVNDITNKPLLLKALIPLVDRATAISALKNMVKESLNIEQHDIAQTVKSLFTHCGTLLTPEDRMELLQNALQFKVRAAPLFIEKIDLATLSPDMLNAILNGVLMAGNSSIVKGDGSMLGPHPNEMITTLNKLWPYLDINNIHLKTPDGARHLLIDTLANTNGDTLDTRILNKIIDDPRLNLPTDILGEAYHKGARNYAKRAMGGCNPSAMSHLANFDPNEQVNGEPMLIALFDEFINITYVRSALSIQTLKDSAPYNALETLFQHDRFDPYLACENGQDMADRLNFIARRDRSGMQKQFIKLVVSGLQAAKERPSPPVRRRLDEAFAKKIAPAQLVDSAGDPSPAIKMAAITGLLPQYLRLNDWAKDLNEAAAYETTLNTLPETFREDYGQQIAECCDKLGECRARFNREAGSAQTGFRSRLGVRTGPRGPAGGMT